MAPRKVAATYRPERGLRLKKELAKIFPMPRSERALILNFIDKTELETNERTIREWLSGGSPSAAGLAAIAELGGDVHYILTGERREGVENVSQAARPAGAELSPLARLCGLLAETGLKMERLPKKHSLRERFDQEVARHLTELEGLAQSPQSYQGSPASPGEGRSAG